MPLLPLKLWKSQHLLLVRGGTIVKEGIRSLRKYRTSFDPSRSVDYFGKQSGKPSKKPNSDAQEDPLSIKHRNNRQIESN
jgi:hypothetical protein